MTPARAITGWTGFIHLRRMLGLFCFFYATVHFLIWLWLDHNFSLVAMWQDVLERPYITFGFLAFVLLVPLALTSNRWAQRKLLPEFAREEAAGAFNVHPGDRDITALISDDRDGR